MRLTPKSLTDPFSMSSCREQKRFKVHHTKICQIYHRATITVETSIIHWQGPCLCCVGSGRTLSSSRSSAYCWSGGSLKCRHRLHTGMPRANQSLFRKVDTSKLRLPFLNGSKTRFSPCALSWCTDMSDLHISHITISYHARNYWISWSYGKLNPELVRDISAQHFQR